MQFRFDREFQHWAMRARQHCVLCKVMALLIYKPGTFDIDEETARAALEAGAGAPVEILGGEGSP